ncbi:MAG: sensor domain-containing diguanylate cyclase [bacterium]
MTELELENERLKEELERLKVEIKRGETRKKIIANTNALLDKSLYELSVINKINTSLSKTLNHHEIIREITSLLSQMIEFVACGILLCEENTFLLRMHLACPRTSSFIASFKAKTLGKYASFSGSLAKEENLVVQIDNPSLIIEDKAERGGILGTFEGVPLKVSDRVIGLLSIAHTKVNTFSSDDLKLIKLLADNSAIAIENGLLHKKIEELAITDGLTHLYNYRYFKEALHKEIKRSERYNLVFSLLMFDIDNFKKINDTYGHPKGDEVLSGLSQIAREIFQREIDVVARYGGEEFVIILPQTTKERASVVGEKMLSLVKERLWTIASLPSPITISLGIASYPVDGETEEAIIESADKALYRAKTEGKDKIVLA